MALQLNNLRLPAWLLPATWPRTAGQPETARLDIDDGIVTRVQPASGPGEGLDCLGALALPGLVEPHAHLDKTYTRRRLGAITPGLLGAIEATQADRAFWTPEDLRLRASRALGQARSQGVTHLRTHLDWWSAETPTAWRVIRELAQDTSFHLEQVALLPLPLLADKTAAQRIAHTLANDTQAPRSVLGAFIHSSNFNAQALHNLLACAAEAGLDLDLHIDEELNTAACGLATVARAATAMQFPGRIVCSHACALSTYPETQAQATLDDVARAPITLVALPATNLYLQDAVHGRTPRLRGLTLLKEARLRGIALLLGSDNVQDAFCPIGNYDPLSTLQLAVLSAQLDDVFDTWSQTVCRADWLSRAEHGADLPGKAAHLTLLHSTDPYSWPADTARSVQHGEHVPEAFSTYLRGLA